MLNDKLTGKPFTRMFFSVYMMPKIDDLKAGRYTENSWYLWKTHSWSPGVTTGCYTIFDAKRGPPTVSENYLPEAGISVKGDVTNNFRVGDTVEITLHIIEGQLEIRL